MTTVRHLSKPQEFNILDLPILYSGPLENCKLYCEMWAGYKWVPDNSIFGGYYAHSDNGDCFLLV